MQPAAASNRDCPLLLLAWRDVFGFIIGGGKRNRGQCHPVHLDLIRSAEDERRAVHSSAPQPHLHVADAHPATVARQRCGPEVHLSQRLGHFVRDLREHDLPPLDRGALAQLDAIGRHRMCGCSEQTERRDEAVPQHARRLNPLPYRRVLFAISSI